MMEILIPIIAVTAIGLICGVGLSIASHVMAVKEDERFPVIRECLPGANCGACGYTGCDGYAKALLEPGTKTNLCVPGADAVAAKVAQVLGVEAEDVVEQIAIVKCSGNCDATKKKHEYNGISTCKAAKLFYGGNGTCTYGCLGFGDCAAVCPQNAISSEKGIAYIDPTKCIGCGLCAKTCPQGIILLLDDIEKAGVYCSSTAKGADTRKSCSAGCLGCKKCEKNCPHDAVHVENNLAVIDYAKCDGCGTCVAGCPTGVIRISSLLGASKKEQ